jgi:hypothetical protein
MKAEPSQSDQFDDYKIDGREPLGAGIDFTDPNSRLAPFYLRNADVFGVLLICLCVTTISKLALWHTDIWGHAAFGEWILEHGRLPDQEPFCLYADKTIEPVHAQWLTQAIYGGLLRWSSAIGRHDDPERRLARQVEFLRAFHLIATAVQFTFLWLACRRVGKATWANLALVLVFMGLFYSTSIQRPQSIGLSCFAIMLFVLSRRELSRAAVYGLPILFLFWANLHGTFAVGLGFFFLTTLGRLARDRWQYSKEIESAASRGPDARRRVAALLLSSAAAMINPHGPLLFVQVVAFAREHPSLQLLSEWQPLDLRYGPGHVKYFALWALLLITWAAARFANGYLLVAILPFGLWPLLQVRGAIWWTMIVPWMVASFGPAISERIGWRRRFPGSIPSFRKTLLAGSIVLLAVMLLRPVLELLGRRLAPLEQNMNGTTVALTSAATPWRLGFELQAAPPDRGRWLPGFASVAATYPGGHYHGAIFSSEAFGDYLMRFAPADAPVTLYTHIHFFTFDYVASCLRVKAAVGDWRAWLAEQRVNLIVVEADTCDDLARELRGDPAWRVLTDDAEASGPRFEGDRLFIAIREKPL